MLKLGVAPFAVFGAATYRILEVVTFCYAVGFLVVNFLYCVCSFVVALYYDFPSFVTVDCFNSLFGS